MSSTMVLSDSKSAIQLVENSATHEISKHIDIDCHFLREHEQSRVNLKLIHVKTGQQLADLLTKGKGKSDFDMFG